MRVALLATLALLLAACAGPAAPTPAAGQVRVVATTTVFADLVRQVGGERVEVHSLVPAGGEVHTFDPAPSDVLRLAEADLLVMNGVGLDEWLVGLARDAGRQDLRVLELGEDLQEVDYIESSDDHADDDAEDSHAGDDHGATNPHLWLDVANGRLYADRIRLALIEMDAAGQADYDDNAEAFDARLAELDGWIREQLAAIPTEQRRAVTFHDAFPYFAAAYGLEIVGVVVESPGQEPSVAQVGRLVDRIRQSGARLILAEAQFSHRLAQAIADEAGVAVVDGLYTDSLGDPPDDSYESAMRANVERITAALAAAAP
ncbi:MAG TPA: metal ABC transporter substrate-binding protein [Candidatus Limnocylindria bacterium]|nr:metal ABC transporter substrate-binding protein [Candidatus Limnocylindria bacterium]